MLLAGSASTGDGRRVWYRDWWGGIGDDLPNVVTVTAEISAGLEACRYMCLGRGAGFYTGTSVENWAL